METDLIILCKHDECIAGLRINSGWTYKQLISTICSKWNDIDMGSIYLRYSFPGHSNGLLDNDEDLQILFSLAAANSIMQVDVDVHHRKKVGHKDWLDENCKSIVDGSSLDMSQLEWRSENNKGSNLFSSFVSHPEKILLSSHWASGITGVGQIFEGGAHEFLTTLCKYAIQCGFEFVYIKNDNVRVTAHCKSQDRGCEWMIHARGMSFNGFFYVKKLNNLHTCGATIRTSKNSRITSDLAGSLIVEDVHSKPQKRQVDVIHEFKSKYGLNISYHQAWLGVDKARGEVFGDYSSSFDQLRWFVNATNRSNPRSSIVLQYDPIRFVFKRLFVTFKSCIDGFNHCRPLLFLDGTFLKGRYKGHLLSATTKDGDQGLFSVCFAIVDAENSKNWHWFMENLSLIAQPGRDVTFLSDRNLDLLDAINSIFPASYHAYCLQHLKNNLRHHLRGHRNAFRERMVNHFVKCAYAPTNESFHQALDLLKREGGPKVRRFIDDTPAEHWSNAYFPGCRYGEMTSNAAESFNNWIRNERHLPITNMADSIRIRLMNQIATWRDIASKWSSVVCPMVDEQLYDAFNDSRTWNVSQSSDNVYKVHSFPSVSVDLVRRTCSCCHWQLYGIPCALVVATVMRSGKDLNEYVDQYYHVNSYRESYSLSIYPVPSMWRTESTLESKII